MLMLIIVINVLLIGTYVYTAIVGYKTYRMYIKICHKDIK